MLTRVLPFGDEAVAEAARLILAGDVVAVPTETVYGLAGDATSEVAVAAIFAAKKRPAFNPLIVHVASLDAALAIGEFCPQALALAEQYWPGPLTIVVPARADSGLAMLATAGLTTVALRVPSHRAMTALLHATGVPLAAPSANASGTLSPTSAAHVLRTLEWRIPLVIDDGVTAGGIESTIVTVTDDQVEVLRPGPLVIEGAVLARQGAVVAPGQLAAHYAPSKPLRLNAVTAAPDEFHLGFGDIGGDVSLSASSDLNEAASQLFAMLHQADLCPQARIAVAPVPEQGPGIAINDRLRRAAVGAPR